MELSLLFSTTTVTSSCNPVVVAWSIRKIPETADFKVLSRCVIPPTPWAKTQAAYASLAFSSAEDSATVVSIRSLFLSLFPNRSKNPRKPTRGCLNEPTNCRLDPSDICHVWSTPDSSIKMLLLFDSPPPSKRVLGCKICPLISTLNPCSSKNPVSTLEAVKWTLPTAGRLAGQSPAPIGKACICIDDSNVASIIRSARKDDNRTSADRDILDRRVIFLVQIEDIVLFGADSGKREVWKTLGWVAVLYKQTWKIKHFASVSTKVFVYCVYTW